MSNRWRRGLCDDPAGGADGGLDLDTEGRIEEMRCSCPSAGGICGHPHTEAGYLPRR